MTASAVRPVAIKVDEDTKARLKRLAEARGRTPHWLMREAITQYVDREESIWHGLYAPKGMPKAVLGRLNQALNVTIRDASFTARIAEFGAVSVAPALAKPEGLRSHLAREIALWGPIIRKAGVFAD